MLYLIIISSLLSGSAEHPQWRTSYAIGSAMARNFTENVPVDTFFALGLVDGLRDRLLDQSQISDEEIVQLLAAFEVVQRERAVAVSEENVTTGDQFRAGYRAGEGVQETASGLLYRIINPGSGNPPKPEDTVVVHYRGTTIDGVEFDSSYARNQPAEFPLNRVISGWTEGLQLIAPGGELELVTPPELAYGKRGISPLIGPNATLKFQVKLLEIKPLELK